MKYRLYVSGFCNNTRNLQSSMGIGGVILNDRGEEKVFSEMIGKGTIMEAHCYAILHGINEILNDKTAKFINVYSTNLLIIDYLNKKNVKLPMKAETLLEKILEILDTAKISIKYEYFEVNDYVYVRNLAEEAIKV